MTRKIAIIGSRDYPTPKDVFDVVRAEVAAHGTGLRTRSGGCSGGPDNWCEQAAKAFKLPPTEVIDAKWRTENGYNPAAGIERNGPVVEDPEVETVYAFWTGKTKSGTWDAVQKAIKAGKHVVIVHRPATHG